MGIDRNAANARCEVGIDRSCGRFRGLVFFAPAQLGGIGTTHMSVFSKVGTVF